MNIPKGNSHGRTSHIVLAAIQMQEMQMADMQF
jgi:hypothetical protein